MKRKIKTGTLLLISVLSLGMTAPAYGADVMEFTDAGDVKEAVMEEDLFVLDEAAGAEEVEFGAGEEFADDGAAAFLAEGEVPETVTLDGIEYEYVAETDSYRVVKGVDAESVKLPYEIHGKKVKEIGEGAFAGFTRIKSVELPGTTMIVGKDAFYGCTNLRGVLGSMQTEDGVFKNCPKLAWIMTYGTDYDEAFTEDTFDSDTKVAYYAFGMNEQVREVFKKLRIFHIGMEDPEYDYNEDIDGMCFIRPRNTENGERTTYVTDFDDDRSEVTVRDRFDYDIVIGRKSFYGSEKIQDVFLKEGVTAIETKAFSNCSNLKRVIMTENVTEIAEDAFEECPNVVIYAPKGSYALTYAKENGIAYKVSKAEKMQRPVLTYVSNDRVENVVTLKWNHIPYADGYQVYRFNSDTKKYERIKTIKDGNRHYYELALRPGRTEYFKVRAYSNAEIYSEKYSPSSLKLKVEAIPAMADFRQILAKYPNKLGLYWKPVEGDGYLIYRSETEPYKGYKKLKYITNSSTTKYMDTGLKTGKTYYYRIRAYRFIDGKRVYGHLSLPYEVTCK